MKAIVSDPSLVAYCGLYCGACGSYLRDRCPGCHENAKATWCKVRSCCIEHAYKSCADCKDFANVQACRKYNNIISKLFGLIFRSNRAACIAQISALGIDGHAEAMAKVGRQSIRRGAAHQSFILGKDEVTPFDSDDPEMNAAIARARETMQVFLKAFERPKRNQRAFLLKVRFEHEGRFEHIWFADLNLGVNPPRGVVANKPELPTLKFMSQTEFSPSAITDWMFVEGGYLVGGFTTRLIYARMSPVERKAEEAALPYKIREQKL